MQQPMILLSDIKYIFLKEQHETIKLRFIYLTINLTIDISRKFEASGKIYISDNGSCK